MSFEEESHTRRASAPPEIIALVALLAGAGHAAAATVHTFPGCGPTPQACIDATVPGDVVQDRHRAADRRIAIAPARTLESAPGFRAIFSGFNTIFDSLPGPRTVRS